jgi:ABC-2 type transport system permease protein
MSVAVETPPPVTTTRTPTPPSWQRSLVVMVRRGLADNRRAPLTWGGALGLMSALMAAIWPSIEDSISKVTESYPSGLKEAFGIEQLDSVEKYIDAEMLSLIVPLALAFFAVRCATRAMVGAEDRGHLDTLLSLPVSRHVLVASSFIVSGLMTASILAVTWVLTIVAGVIAGAGISADTLALGLGNVWPLAMAFAGLAVLVGGVAHRPVTVTEVAAGTLVAMYVMDLAGKLSESVEPLRTVSAFRYYGSVIQNGFDVSHALLLTTVGVACAVIGAILFDGRDVL